MIATRPTPALLVRAGLRLGAGSLLFGPAAARAHGAESHWSTPDVVVAIALMASAGLYAAALLRRAPLRGAQVAAFGAGWLLLVMALAFPLDRLAAESFALHMVQHELLMVLAPPLLILGRPFAALAATLPPAALRLAAWPLRFPPLGAWLLHAAALWIWHVPRLFDAAALADSVHALQHASFFFSALLFWWAVLRRVRSGVAVLYLLTTLIHSGALAALLTFAPVSIYAGVALEEQQLGGLVMWVPAGYGLIGAGMLAFNRLLAAHA